MNDRAHRKELVEQYKQAQPAAGVYRIVNTRTQRGLLGSTPNLGIMRNKMEFARETKMFGVLDRRLRPDIVEFGFEAFELEVLEVLEAKPEMTAADIKRDLAVMEALWREQFAPESLY